MIERREGSLLLRLDRLGAGTHSLTLPLVVSAAGRFSAGGAWLRMAWENTRYSLAYTVKK